MELLLFLIFFLPFQPRQGIEFPFAAACSSAHSLSPFLASCSDDSISPMEFRDVCDKSAQHEIFPSILAAYCRGRTLNLDLCSLELGSWRVCGARESEIFLNNPDENKQNTNNCNNKQERAKIFAGEQTNKNTPNVCNPTLPLPFFVLARLPLHVKNASRSCQVSTKRRRQSRRYRAHTEHICSSTKLSKLLFGHVGQSVLKAAWKDYRGDYFCPKTCQCIRLKICA